MSPMLFHLPIYRAASKLNKLSTRDGCHKTHGHTRGTCYLIRNSQRTTDRELRHSQRTRDRELRNSQRTRDKELRPNADTHVQYCNSRINMHARTATSHTRWYMWKQGSRVGCAPRGNGSKHTEQLVSLAAYRGPKLTISLVSRLHVTCIIYFHKPSSSQLHPSAAKKEKR